MQKEILTKQIIEKELKKYFSRNLLISVIFFPFYLIVCALLVFLLILLINLVVANKEALKIIAIVAVAILGLFYLYEASIISVIAMIKTIKGDFQISEDWVVDKLPKRYGRYTHKPNTLVFAKGGKYAINDLNYEWSSLFSMNDESVFRSSNIDDDFYVVSAGKSKNVLAYNKKFFDLL